MFLYAISKHSRHNQPHDVVVSKCLWQEVITGLMHACMLFLKQSYNFIHACMHVQ